MVFEARSWKSLSAVTFPIGKARAYGVEGNLFEDFQLLVSGVNQHVAC
jgi:hypothetical protein